MMINEMKNSRSSDLLPMFYDCKYFSKKKKKKKPESCLLLRSLMPATKRRQCTVQLGSS